MTATGLLPTPEAPATTTTLNVANLLAQVNGDRAFLCELMGLFDQELPGYLDELGAAIRGQNPGEIRAAAHRLRSPLSFFQAQPAEHLAEQLEGMGRQGCVVHAAGIWAQLAKEMGRVRLYLEDLRTRMKAESGN